jgi:hypothetical protein
MPVGDNEEEEINHNEYEEHKGEPIPRATSQAIDVTESPDLGAHQNKAFTHILKSLEESRQTRMKIQFLLIVHGGPGVGKSTFARALVERLLIYSIHVICCAPTGMAASVLIDGLTIHTLLSIPVIKERSDSNRKMNRLSDEQLLEKREFFKKCKVVLIDETSMIDPPFLAKINDRLVQIMDCEEPFGGLNIVLLGDFFQLKPVGTSLFDAVMNDIPSYKVNTQYSEGIDLISKFSMITFDEQFRSEDPIHTEMINQMRTSGNRSPINQSVIDNFKVLSAQDIKNDPSWLTAPVVVACNRERHALNVLLAKRFAIANGVPILRWQRQIVKQCELGEVCCDLLYAHEPLLTGLFVEGARATLIDNLNATSGLANGTRVILHSVIFKECDHPNEIRTLIDRAQPGDIIDVPVPHAVCVSVPSINPEKWALTHETLIESEVVIPLVNKRCPKSQITLDSEPLYFKSHQFDLAFGITYHKVQGQTENKIILDINKRPQILGTVDFHGLYVGMTRVKFGDNIRILPCQDGNNFEHLLKLKPSNNLVNWLRTIKKLE